MIMLARRRMAFGSKTGTSRKIASMCARRDIGSEEKLTARGHIREQTLAKEASVMSSLWSICRATLRVHCIPNPGSLDLRA